MNLGLYSYHKSIYDAFPDTVVDFTHLKDASNLNEFDIGGVDQHSDTTTIKAVVTYKTPFRYHGDKTQLSFGLSPTASINTVIGLTFLRSTRCVLMFANDGKDAMVCQDFGETFEMTFQPPHRANVAPSAGEGTCQSFLVARAMNSHTQTPPEVLEGLDHCRLKLAESLANAATEPLATVATTGGGAVIKKGYTLSPDAVKILAPEVPPALVQHDWVLESSKE